MKKACSRCGRKDDVEHGAEFCTASRLFEEELLGLLFSSVTRGVRDTKAEATLAELYDGITAREV